ncbi:hypothetical protein B7494_g6573 [Chlorociboria aeruginascens]|nr:hypothetical protein B7494_g6573 [Chlorociboria aeruginascens]
MASACSPTSRGFTSLIRSQKLTLWGPPYQMARLSPGSSPSSSKPPIHILGLGNLGCLFAHALATLPSPPPTTLLFHRPTQLEEWEHAGRQMTITTNGTPSSSSGYAVEVIQPPSRPVHNGFSSQSEEIIQHLILTTKTTHTLKALASIKQRLNASSTILFTQNGMGTIEQATAHLFPDPSTRPSYLACITSHGIYSTSSFRSVHAGFGTVAIGPVRPLDPPKPQVSYLQQEILQCSILASTPVPANDLFILQIEKLIINAMINPLTFIFRLHNGELFPRLAILSLMRLLLSEAHAVITSLPQLQNQGNGRERLEVERLEKAVLEVARKTARNKSSMFQDGEKGRETEIACINGWLVDRGRERGARSHQMAVDLEAFLKSRSILR